MLVQAKKIVLLSLMSLAVAVISLPAVSYSATSPAVSALSPLTKGLRAPVKLVIDADGNMYIADQRLRGVVKFNAYGVQQMLIRTAAAPNGLAFALDGTLLVSQDSFVARYDVQTGLEVGRLGGVQLQYPVGIAVDDVTGFIYVADARANQIMVYNASGVYSKSFSEYSVAGVVGKLSMPTGIVFEKVSRNLIVADTLGSKIHFFDVDGNYVKSIGNTIPKGTAAISSVPVSSMQFFMPVAVALEYTKDTNPVLSRMYVVDSYRSNLQVIDATTGSALGIAAGATAAWNKDVNYSKKGMTVAYSGTAYISLKLNNLNHAPSDATWWDLDNYIGYNGSTNNILDTLLTPNDAVFDSQNSRLLVVNGSGYITIYGIDGGKNPVYVEPPVVVLPPPPVEIPAPALAIVTSPFVTKNSAVLISGTVEDGAAVDVAGKIGEVVVVGTSWSCNVALVEGVNVLSVTATKLGKSTTKTVAVTLDTVAPVLNVSALATGSYTSTSVVNISGSATDLNGATVKINGETATLTENKFSVAVTLLNGANQISVEAADSVGNTVLDSRTYNYDATVPYLSILAPVDNSFTTNSELKISGTVDKTSVITVQGLPATLDANTWSATINLDAGVNTIEIVAIDLYGNSSSVKRSITLDAIKPAIAVVSPAQDVAVKQPNVLIEGTVSDVTALTLEYSVNGSVVAVPVNAGAYSFNVDFTAEGKYPVVLTAKDSAGNVSTVVRTVIYDITQPAFSLDQVVGVMPEKLSGTVEDGSSIVVKAILDKDVPESVGTVSIANGTWSADLAGVAYAPDSLLAVATDAAGNSTSKALTYRFPSGTLNADGTPTVQDALRAIRIVVNQLTPSTLELASYDIGPLVGGKPNPDGKIEIVDAILILRKALGLKSW